MNSSNYLPPPAVGRWRAYERSALQIRGFAGLGIHARLDPYALATSLGLEVVNLKDLAGLSQATKDLLGSGSAWSGGAITGGPQGSHLILLNSSQSPRRCAATLMEEICHILFGHKPTTISASMAQGRDYDPIKEEEAYGVGAAALLPYFALKSALAAGQSFKSIAQRFGVSVPLVGYRSKGLQLSFHI